MYPFHPSILRQAQDAGRTDKKFISRCYACDAGEGTRQEIAERYGVSLGMVKKILAQRKKLGILDPLNHRCGRKSMLSEQDLLWLRKTVEQRQDLTLEKLCRANRKSFS